MGLNSYQETCIHDEQKKGWGESSVFRVDYPDGKASCMKEYHPGISYNLLNDYHALHNFLSKHPVEFDFNFYLEGRTINKVRFMVLPLGDQINQATSLKNKEEICLSTVPYVGGTSFHEIIHSSTTLMSALYDARDQFINIISKKFPFFSSADTLDYQLSTVNMKCIEKGDGIMYIIITDLCGTIETVHNLCDIQKLKLLETLHATSQHVTQ
ncbi:MAG: hypothetical protein WCO66_05125 [Candidatus Absconditabacteria bacterium]